MNPGLSVHLHVDEKDDGKIHFKMIYIYFKAMIEGWNVGCRKVIGLDGCFLKGTCRGKLLTAMGRDGNNQMFPIAWDVFNVENTDDLEWFLASLCEDLRLNCGAYMTIISDGHKRAPGRKKVGSNFVFQAGPSVAYLSSAGPSVADPSSAGPSVTDPSSAGPSVADSTASSTQAETVIEDPIVAYPTDDIMDYLLNRS
ncbi:60S ribosomal protein L34 [Tanacetum coccineum]